ncbi:MAG: hypothetical protein IKD90_01980, partial [Clostridiales bacterium]|nr:hypothetical protein [Clostridiales bacterium]
VLSSAPIFKGVSKNEAPFVFFSSEERRPPRPSPAAQEPKTLFFLKNRLTMTLPFIGKIKTSKQGDE